MGKVTLKTKKGLTLVSVIIFALVMVFIYKKSIDHHVKISVTDNNIDLLLKIDDLDLNQPSKDGTIEVESTSSQEEKVLDTKVYIYGHVNVPGSYDMKTSEKLKDVLQKAGGTLSSADLSKINMDKQIILNEVIYIPDKEEDIIYNDKRNCYYSVKELNELDKVSLDELDGIGEVMAERIIDYRDEHGPFEKLEDLKKIKGIGDKKYTMILNVQ